MTAPIDPTTAETEQAPVTAENPTPEAGKGVGTTDTTPEADATPEVDAKPDNEAAKYRRRLREAETERDTYATRLDVLQRQVIESVCDAAGFKAAGFWASGVEIKDLLDEDGGIDPDKISAAIEMAVSTLGLEVRPRVPQPNPQQGGGSYTGGGLSWSDALNG
ncbi:hypothetical protein ABH922_000909 [Rhodococcus sp. 27YEA15]|uniref:hypothetical protein n=1 Tax=Rhodococcus sp. 27YEA15 TaxID=3156259 RepID=UPI003C7EA8FC